MSEDRQEIASPDQVEYQENVAQESVVDNDKWGEQNKSADEQRPEFWSNATDENAEEDAGAATGGS